VSKWNHKAPSGHQADRKQLFNIDCDAMTKVALGNGQSIEVMGMPVTVPRLD